MFLRKYFRFSERFKPRSQEMFRNVLWSKAFFFCFWSFRRSHSRSSGQWVGWIATRNTRNGNDCYLWLFDHAVSLSGYSTVLENSSVSLIWWWDGISFIMVISSDWYCSQSLRGERLEILSVMSFSSLGWHGTLDDWLACFIEMIYDGDVYRHMLPIYLIGVYKCILVYTMNMVSSID